MISHYHFLPAQQAVPEAEPTPYQTQTVVHVNASGAVYVRWGKSECPESAELIYSGKQASNKQIK